MNLIEKEGMEGEKRGWTEEDQVSKWWESGKQNINTNKRCKSCNDYNIIYNIVL